MATSERNDSGASLLEYSVLIALIAAVGIVTMSACGDAIQKTFANELLTSAVAAGSITGDCTANNPNYPDC